MKSCTTESRSKPNLLENKMNLGSIETGTKFSSAVKRISCISWME